MPLDELTDEELDQRLRELLPSTPRSRGWERAQRERLLHYITTGDSDFAEVLSTVDTTDTVGQVVELRAGQPERSTGRWTVGVAAAAVILVSGLLVVQRATDTPAPAQPGPVISNRYSTVEEVLDDFDRIEQTVGQLDSDRQTQFYETYFDCMASAGFDVPREVRPTVNASPVAPAFTLDLRANQAFEQAPRSVIAERGYAATGLEAGSADAAPDPNGDPLSQWIETMSPAQQAAYAVADMGGPDAPTIEYSDAQAGAWSMPASGCNYAALQSAHGDVEAWFRTTIELNTLHGLVTISALDSDTYQSAVADWTRCLTESSIQIDDPNIMSGTVDQAVADRDCRDQADLAGARSAALLTNANQYRDQLKGLVSAADTLANTDVAGQGTLAGQAEPDAVDPAIPTTTIPAVNPHDAMLFDVRNEAYSALIADILPALALQETAAERLQDPFTGIRVAMPTEGSASVTVTFTLHLWYPGEFTDDVDFYAAVTGSSVAGVPIDGGQLFVISDAAGSADHTAVGVVTPDGSITIEAAPVPGAPNPRPVTDVITLSDMTNIAEQLTGELAAIASGTTT